MKSFVIFLFVVCLGACQSVEPPIHTPQPPIEMSFVDLPNSELIKGGKTAFFQLVIAEHALVDGGQKTPTVKDLEKKWATYTPREKKANLDYYFEFNGKDDSFNSQGILYEGDTLVQYATRDGLSSIPLRLVSHLLK